MTFYEYDEVFFRVPYTGQRASTAFTTLLTQRSQEGWELVSDDYIGVELLTGSSTYRTSRRALFRRQKTEPAGDPLEPANTPKTELLLS